MSADIVKFAICNAANERRWRPTHPDPPAVAYSYRAYDTKVYLPPRYCYGRRSPTQSPQPGAPGKVPRASPWRSGPSCSVR